LKNRNAKKRYKFQDETQYMTGTFKKTGTVGCTTKDGSRMAHYADCRQFLKMGIFEISF